MFQIKLLWIKATATTARRKEFALASQLEKLVELWKILLQLFRVGYSLP